MNTLRKTAMSAMGVLSMLAFQVLMLATSNEARYSHVPLDRRPWLAPLERPVRRPYFTRLRVIGPGPSPGPLSIMIFSVISSPRMMPS